MRINEPPFKQDQVTVEDLLTLNTQDRRALRNMLNVIKRDRAKPKKARYNWFRPKREPVTALPEMQAAFTWKANTPPRR